MRRQQRKECTERCKETLTKLLLFAQDVLIKQRSLLPGGNPEREIMKYDASEKKEEGGEGERIFFSRKRQKKAISALLQ